jgi:hypothetical protein
MKYDTTGDVIPHKEARIVSAEELRQNADAYAKLNGAAPLDLNFYLQEATGGTKEDATAILANRHPDYLIPHGTRTAGDLEKAREGLRALLSVVNGEEELAVRLLAGEIAGEHRHTQGTAVSVLVKALRLLCERDEEHFDARNDWTRRLAPKLAALYD